WRVARLDVDGEVQVRFSIGSACARRAVGHVDGLLIRACTRGSLPLEIVLVDEFQNGLKACAFDSSKGIQKCLDRRPWTTMQGLVPALRKSLDDLAARV